MSNPAILIVEDEEIISADIANKLRKLGYGVAGSAGIGSGGQVPVHKCRGYALRSCRLRSFLLCPNTSLILVRDWIARFMCHYAYLRNHAF